jgi:hypothetical protein
MGGEVVIGGVVRHATALQAACTRPRPRPGGRCHRRDATEDGKPPHSAQERTPYSAALPAGGCVL